MRYTGRAAGVSRGIHCAGSTRVTQKDTHMTELQTPAPGTDFPGKTLGIVGLILAIFFNLIGLIISAVALNQSKTAGFKNGPAKAGIIVGAILLGLGIIITIISIIASAAIVGTAGVVTTY